MDEALLNADLQARRDALDVTRSFIVQAPAGSGKTELLIQRYLCLLATVDEPEEIVAITFTRKAAQEMRQRVVSALLRAKQPKGDLEDYQQVTFDAACRVLARDGQLGWNLLTSHRRMRIQTLDAFNSGIARSLPVSSGLGGISRTVADAEMSAYYRQAAAATLDWLVTGDALANSVETLLAHLDNNTSIYIAYISRMLQSRDQWLALIGSGWSAQGDYQAARDKLEQAIADVVAAQLKRASKLMPAETGAELASLIDYAVGNLAGQDKLSFPLTSLQGIAGIPGTDIEDRNQWQAVSQMLLVQSGAIRKTVNKNNGFPATDNGQKKAFVALLDQLRQIAGLDDSLNGVRSLPEPCYSDEQWDVLVALFRLLPVAVAELRQIFGQNSVCDHVEVSLAARAALGDRDSPGDVAMMLDYRIRHLLVDEMQDTSLGQYRLLEQLMEGWTPGDGRSIFCVGDPMQSIYRFRDAEVGQFLLAKHRGLGNVVPDFLLLHQNFRSGEHIVHWVNTVFGQVMPLSDDIAAGAIAYAESVPVPKHEGKGSATVHALIDHDSQREAAFGAGFIRQHLEDHPAESLAVLVRSRAQLIDLLSELRRTGTDYHAVEIDRMTDLPEITDLLALTRALCHESDRIAWLGLLHGPWVGLEWQDILTLVVNDSHRSVRELMEDGERRNKLSADGLRRLNDFSETIAAHLDHTAVQKLRERVERCWYALGGPGLITAADSLANVYLFLDLLEKIDSSGTIADVGELESLLDQERVSSAAGTDCPLQIMTMHKSKGLQFDHVLLYGLGRVTRGSQKSVLSWLSIPDGDDNDMIISPVGPRAEMENDPLHQYIESTESDKQKHELDRLLYVACTRARKSLHLIGNIQTDANGNMPKSADARSLLHRLWPAIEHDFQRKFDALPDRDEQQAREANDRYREPACKRFRSRWHPGEAPPFPLQSTLEGKAAAASEREVEFYWVGAQARHAGIIVHRWIQKMTMATDTAAATNPEKQRSVSERWALQLGVRNDDIDTVCRRVATALKSMLEDDTGQWLIAGGGQCELPLTGIWGDGLTSIVIDRVRIDDQGRHWIVDYKTSTHEGGDLDGFLAQESDRYREQLQKYAAIYSSTTDSPVRTALYFPLLKSFCEVNTDEVGS